MYAHVFPEDDLRSTKPINIGQTITFALLESSRRVAQDRSVGRGRHQSSCGCTYISNVNNKKTDDIGHDNDDDAEGHDHVNSSNDPAPPCLITKGRASPPAVSNPGGFRFSFPAVQHAKTHNVYSGLLRFVCRSVCLSVSVSVSLALSLSLSLSLRLQDKPLFRLFGRAPSTNQCSFTSTGFV